MILQSAKPAPAEDVVLGERSEAVFYAVAENLGFLLAAEEAESLEAFVESAAGAVALREMKSVVRLNRQAKLDSLIVHSALIVAEHKKDPLYKKYAAAAGVKRKYRALIVRKYNTTAQSMARKLLANAGKKGMVDVSSSSAINAMHQHGSESRPVGVAPVQPSPAPSGPGAAMAPPAR